MRDRLTAPGREIAISVASSLLAVALGFGITFTLWTRLHATNQIVVYAALGALAVGFGLLAFGLEHRALRSFTLALASAVVVGLFAAPLILPR